MEKQIILYDRSCADDLDVERKYLNEHNLADKYEIVKFGLDTPEFAEYAAKADGMCIYTPLTADRLKEFPKAKVIAIPALGADLAYPDAANEAGIYICNAPAYCNEDVATHSVALILACARRITCFDRSLKEGRWNIHEGGVLHRLSTMTHGMVSLGRIARETGRMMRDAFHVKLMAYDPLVPDSVFEEMGIKRAESIEELMASCDIVSVHTPLFDSTHHLIGKKQFDAIRKPIIFVVTSRGGVVDETALREAIVEGKVEAAGIDVVEDEQNFKSVLTDLPEVTQTPHVAYYSQESDDSLRIINLSEIIKVLEYGELPDNLINKSVSEKK